MKKIILALCIVLTSVYSEAAERRQIINDPGGLYSLGSKIKEDPEAFKGMGMYPPADYQYLDEEGDKSIYYIYPTGYNTERTLSVILQPPKNTIIDGYDYYGYRVTITLNCVTGESKMLFYGLDISSKGELSPRFTVVSNKKPTLPKKMTSSDKYYKIMCNDIGISDIKK